MDFHLSLRIPANVSQEKVADYARTYPPLHAFQEIVGEKTSSETGWGKFPDHGLPRFLSDIEEFDCKPAIYLKKIQARIELFLIAGLYVLCAKKSARKIVLSADLKEKVQEADKILGENK